MGPVHVVEDESPSPEASIGCPVALRMASMILSSSGRLCLLVVSVCERPLVMSRSLTQRHKAPSLGMSPRMRISASVTRASTNLPSARKPETFAVRLASELELMPVVQACLKS